MTWACERDVARAAEGRAQVIDLKLLVQMAKGRSLSVKCNASRNKAKLSDLVTELARADGGLAGGQLHGRGGRAHRRRRDAGRREGRRAGRHGPSRAEVEIAGERGEEIG